MAWRSPRSRRNSSPDRRQPGGYGPVNLLQPLVLPNRWNFEIHGDMDRLRKQLTKYVPRKEWTSVLHHIVRGIASLLESLLHETARRHRNFPEATLSLVSQTACKSWLMKLGELESKDRLNGGPIKGWWQYCQVELEPYHPLFPRERLHEGQLPGHGLEGKTVWYRDEFLNKDQHQLTDISIAPHDHFGQSHLSGSYFLQPSRPDDLPGNPGVSTSSARGFMAGFFCLSSAPNPETGREETQWRWFWGKNPGRQASIEDFVTPYSGRMDVGPSSASVVFKGAPVNPHHPVQRAEHEVGQGLGVRN
ncbi:hypothetical protein JCM6882_009352 [Rhodosporidiobolus microsporus]